MLSPRLGLTTRSTDCGRSILWRELGRGLCRPGQQPKSALIHLKPWQPSDLLEIGPNLAKCGMVASFPLLVQKELRSFLHIRKGPADEGIQGSSDLLDLQMWLAKDIQDVVAHTNLCRSLTVSSHLLAPGAGYTNFSGCGAAGGLPRFDIGRPMFFTGISWRPEVEQPCPSCCGRQHSHPILGVMLCSLFQACVHSSRFCCSCRPTGILELANLLAQRFVRALLVPGFPQLGRKGSRMP